MTEPNAFPDHTPGWVGHDPETDILGIDNVRLDLPIAGLASRMLAASLDTILLFVAMAVWITVAVAAGMFTDSAGGFLAALVLAGIFGINWGYYITFELMLDGQTPGKRLIHLRTVSDVGGRAAAAAIVLRNLMRPIDYLVGVLAIFLDRKARRLGDRLAGTLVIHERRTPQKPEIARVPAGWGPNEISLVECFLDRVGRMEKERAEELAQKILRGLRERQPDFFQLPNGSVPLTDPVFELLRILDVRAPVE